MKSLVALLLPFVTTMGFVPTPAPEYVIFVSKVTDRIDSQLKETQIQVPERIRVHMRINKNGKVSRLTKKISCGDYSLDSKVLKAIKKGEPYPDLPLADGIAQKFFNLQVDVNPEKVRVIYLPPF